MSKELRNIKRTRSIRRGRRRVKVGRWRRSFIRYLMFSSKIFGRRLPSSFRIPAAKAKFY